MAAQTPSDLALGKYLKIVSQSGVYNSLSEDSPLWEHVKKIRKGEAEGREKRFNLRSTYGAAAAGFVQLNGAYPVADKSTLNEGTAQYKDFALTVEVERSIVAKAMSDFSRYGEPLAEEMRAKTISLSRQLSRAAQGDGTGVVGTVASAAVSGGKLVVTLSSSNSARGFVGWFELGDKITIYDNTGATSQAPTLSSGTHSYFTVDARSRANNTVTLTSRTSAGAALTVTAANDVGAGDLLYRTLQATRADLSSALATDFQGASEDFVGLEGLTAYSGEIVNGITHSGALAGTHFDANAQPIDSQDFQQLMSQIMVAVGQGRYKYSQALMAWETLDALVESRETDRRFQDVKDNRRGVESLGYLHGRNNVVFEADEFTRKDRIWVIPEGDCLQFHGSDFQQVKPEGGSAFHLKPNSSGYDRSIQSFMEGSGTLINVHAAATGRIHNFTV